MYLLDFHLPQVVKLSRALQTKNLDLLLISRLMDATLNSLDDAILPSANWVLQLQDAREELKVAIEPFIRHIKVTYPVGLDTPQKMCYQQSVFFIQRKCPASLLMSYLYMEAVQFKLSLEGTEFEKAAIVSSDLSTERKTYHQLRIKQPKDDISMQLKELLTNDKLIALFPNLHKLATICLSIPISTASAEQSFSDMKLIKNHLHNRLTELSLSNLMKIVIESPEKLTDSDLEEIVDVWNRKGGRLLCKLSFRLLSHYICILSLLMHLVKHLTSIM